MSNPIKWVLYFLGVGQGLQVGSRVRTKHGWGTIVGGSLMVRHDVAPPGPGHHPNNRTRTYNIGRPEVALDV